MLDSKSVAISPGGRRAAAGRQLEGSWRARNVAISQRGRRGSRAAAERLQLCKEIGEVGLGGR